jgi:hypothetical protein
MVNFVKNFAIQGGKKAQDMKFVLLGNERIRCLSPKAET